jgi:hypothetical protein
MLSIAFSQCYAECRYVQCHFAECGGVLLVATAKLFAFDASTSLNLVYLPCLPACLVCQPA